MSLWEMVKLDDVTDLITCGVAKRPDYINHGIPFLSAKNVKNGKIIFKGYNCISEEMHRSLTKNNKPMPGDILYTRVGSVGEAAVIEEGLPEFSIFVSLTLIKPKSNKINSHFLKYLLNSAHYKKMAIDNLTGIGVGNLNVKTVRQFLIPLPPLPEQQLIVARLDKAQQLIDQREEQLALIDTLAQSLFHEMFGDPVRNDKSWESLPLTEACFAKSGGTPSKTNPDFWEGNLPWFSPKDLKKPDLFDSQDHINENVTDLTTLRLLPENTVVFVVRGMILAHTFPVSVLRVKATINQDMKALIPRVALNHQFLANCLRAQAKFALQQVSEAGHGTKRLDTEGMNKLRVLIPPLPLQEIFADRVQQIEVLRQTMATSLKELQHTFQALLQEAFPEQPSSPSVSTTLDEPNMTPLSAHSPKEQMAVSSLVDSPRPLIERSRDEQLTLPLFDPQPTSTRS
jgi:type I restriction enzyme S subunit